MSVLSALSADLAHIERLRLVGYRDAASAALDLLDAELEDCRRAINEARRTQLIDAFNPIPTAPRGEDGE